MSSLFARARPGRSFTAGVRSVVVGSAQLNSTQLDAAQRVDAFNGNIAGPEELIGFALESGPCSYDIGVGVLSLLCPALVCRGYEFNVA